MQSRNNWQEEAPKSNIFDKNWEVEEWKGKKTTKDGWPTGDRLSDVSKHIWKQGKTFKIKR